MRAIVQDSYGEPADVLKLEEIAIPAIKDDEVLVRVRAASLAAGDLLLMRGVPLVMRAGVFGLRRPKQRVPGLDVAGTVEAVGAEITGFKVGDEVFGEGIGTLSEYARVKAARLAAKPEGVSFEQAAVLPVSASTALQGLRDAGQVRSGQKVLINGASGGVGTYAVQVAKWLGADVTAVCSTSKIDLVRSLGADHVIDYTEKDFTKRDDQYDIILDNVANHPLSDLRRLLAPNGVLLPSNGTSGGRWFGPLGRILAATVVSPFGRRKTRIFVGKANTEDLGELAELVAVGKITPVIDEVYDLAQSAEAAAYVGGGHARGKIVITV